MSQNHNGISSLFFKPKVKPKFFLLKCIPDEGGEDEDNDGEADEAIIDRVG